MTNLNILIEDLIEQNACDFEISKLIKKSIQEYLTSINEQLKTVEGKEFFVQHTKKIDTFLVLLFKYMLRKYFGPYLPMGSLPINLIALGSYGREQLCIYSDIDLMVLYEDTQGYNLKPLIEEFITISWDCGLKLGSRVHEIHDVQSAVLQDITIKTSLLESRLIYGSKHLWFSYQTHLKNIKRTNQKEFILEKLEEHRQRLIKYPLQKEPNIKDGYGGMRESNMLFWVATVLYNIDDVKNLIDKEFSEEEYRKYRISLEFIFKVRSVLHLVAKKKLDQVTFDLLPEISSKLGFKDRLRANKETLFMTKLFSSMHSVHFFTMIMIEKLTRKISSKPLDIKNLKEVRFKKNIYILNQKVYTSFYKKPNTLSFFLKELQTLPNSVNDFDKSYIYYASKTILPQKLTNEHKKYIKTILFSSTNLYCIIKLLHESGLFEILFPTTKKIINLPQFDGYHQHSVDVHSIQSLKHLENIEDSFVADIYNHLSEKHKSWAKIATLFHDVGKGRLTDHHLSGEKLFKNMARLLNFENEPTQIISYIIRYHNLMSMVATNEDIYSQKVVLSFTATIKNKLALDILYVVTYADISAVAPHIYTNSTAFLLKKLYLQSIQAFDNSELLSESTRRVTKINSIKNLAKYKELPLMMKKKISYISSNQIFLQLKASEILELAIKAKEIETFGYKIINDEVLIIRIIKAIPLNLGYLLGKLEFLNIASMNIFKLFDNKKCFEVTFSEKVDENTIEYVKNVIEDSFDMHKNTKHLIPKIEKNEVLIDYNHSQSLASVKIKTKDQKGLLAYITKIFDDFNIEIESAKIYTSRGKTRDLFLIEKNDDFCSNQEKIVNLLCNK